MYTVLSNKKNIVNKHTILDSTKLNPLLYNFPVNLVNSIKASGINIIHPCCWKPL